MSDNTVTKESVATAKSIVDFFELECKAAKKQLDCAKQEARGFGHYDDCGSFYNKEVIRAQQNLDTLVSVKIKMEKYWRKLRHQLNGD